MRDTTSDLFTEYDLFIFDLDGTLYDLQTLRNIMLRSLVFRWFTFRVPTKDLKIIRWFRQHREENLGYASPGVHEEQYEWVGRTLGIPAEEVQRVIEQWMLVYPLKHLRKARYPGVKSLFTELRKRNKKLAVYSDFPVDQKLSALHLTADKTYCSTDKSIAQLKPSKQGTEKICRDFNCTPGRAIFLGDREDTDGESARQAGVRFIRVDPDLARTGKFYRKLIFQYTTGNHE